MRNDAHMPFGFSLNRPGPLPPKPTFPPNLAAKIPLPTGSEAVGAPHKLPPPSDAQRISEVATSHAFEAIREPATDKWSNYMAEFGGSTLWVEEATKVRAEIGAAAGARVTAGLAAAMGSALLHGSFVGPQFKSARPYEIDPTLTTVGMRPGTTSYPSGHTVQAFAAATVLSAAAPWRAEREFDLARQTAMSRVYAGMHLPSDVEAGARLGREIGQSIVEKFHITAERQPPHGPTHLL